MGGAPGTRGTHVQGHVGHLGMIKIDLAESAPQSVIGLRNFHFPIDLIHVRHGGLDDGEHEYTECHRDDHDDDDGDNDVITGDHWSLLVMTRSVRRRQGQDNTAPTRHVTNV